MENILKDKKIVLGVCGGIAAYKVVELLRFLQKKGARVRVVMTRNAKAFVGPMTFEAISGQPVLTSLFDEGEDASIKHIKWAEEAEAVIIAPVTANVIGKLAGGLADDALTTFMLAVTCPKLVCPSMNTNMYENVSVQRNLDTLAADGYFVVEPGTGELACGTSGAGRLPEPDFIVDRLLHSLCPKDLKDKKVLVTAGPTQEPIDPVRYVSNHSSGKMGYAIARAAEYRGAKVVLVSGPTSLQTPLEIDLINVTTAQEMYEAVSDQMENAHIIIKVAAVADYRPKDPADRKIKKKNDTMELSLEKNIDILKEIGKKKKNQVVVGFAAETQDLQDNAVKKLKEKNLDMIAGNLVGSPDSGFGADTNKVTLFFKDGTHEALEMMEKDAVAHIILDRIAGLMG
jgi:phosphopantothenoylcysteine decarboxylase/phosphopantothenate--cysteine ligase